MVRHPIVVAAPRSGFSLLIQITNTLMARHPRPEPAQYRDRVLRGLVDVWSRQSTQLYQRVFERFGITSDLIFNGEFHKLIGGPKWISEQLPQRACFRKYFGVRGRGDFLLVTSHPRQVLEYDPVVHSHTAPRLWLEQPYYDDCLKLTSIRNPIGIINSASFSLNAMASEYVQRFMPRVSETFLRQRLALYKLTDLDFVRGLVKFLKGYLEQYLPVRDQYHTMRWEDLITDPVRTIQDVGSWLDLKVSADEAAAIWKPMDHVNLLQFHKHNYRQGKGIVGDWKNSLVNEHLDIFREFGYDKYLAELGYPSIPELDPRDYSPYQRLVANYLQRGEIYRCTGDENLFNFAFNKSNIDASSFNFKSYPQRDWTRVERSCLEDDGVVLAVSDVAEQMCADANSLFDEALSVDIRTPQQAERLLADLTRRSESLFEARAGRLPGKICRDESHQGNHAAQTGRQAAETVDVDTRSPLFEKCPELLLVNCDSAEKVLSFAAECSNSIQPLPGLSHDWQRDVAALLRPGELRAVQDSPGLDSSGLDSSGLDSNGPDVTAACGVKPQAGAGSRLPAPLTCLADFVGLPLEPLSPAGAPNLCSGPLPRLVEEGRRGFNIVEFQGRYFALAQSLGPIDVTEIDEAWLAGRTPHEAIVNQILVNVTRQIDELSFPVADEPSESAAAPSLPTPPLRQPRWLGAIRPRLRRHLAQLLSKIPRGGE